MAEVSFCFVTTFYPPHHFGGDAVSTQRLARGIAARGHRVRVVHAPTAFGMLGGRPDHAPPTHEDARIEVVACGAGRTATAGTYLTGMALGYRQHLESLLEGFDVLVYCNPSLIGGPDALTLGEALKVYVISDHWLVCPTHHLFRFQREVCTKRTCWRCSAVYRRPPQPWRSTRLLERSLRHIDLFVSPSRFTAGLHEGALGTSRVEVIPLPGPDHGSLPTTTSERSQDAYFLFVGRLEPLKGVDRVIDAVCALQDAHLVVVGTGSQMSALAQSAAKDRVRFVGQASQDEVLELCAGARALVLPSVGYETFGLAAAEAMAMGTAVVVRDLGPLPELVEEGGGVTFRDEEDLTRTLRRLLDDPQWASAMGERAQSVFDRRFARPVVVQRYLETIARVAAETGRSELARRAAAAANSS